MRPVKRSMVGAAESSADLIKVVQDRNRKQAALDEQRRKKGGRGMRGPMELDMNTMSSSGDVPVSTRGSQSSNF